MKKRKTSFIKTVATVCAAVLLFCVLYLPCGFAFAENSESGEVSVTFVDALNNNTVTVKGAEGELLKFPSDPVDQNNKQWFLGWYTDETYTTEYTADKFGNGDITLYAYWKSEIPGLTQDFENYDKDQYEIEVKSGAKQKNNRLYFGDMFSKVSDVTYNNSGYAVKLDWDSTMVKDPDDENTYNAANRHKQSDMKVWLGNGLNNNEHYVATIHYKAEKAGADFRFIMVSASINNIWTGMVAYGDNSANNIKAGSVTGEWQTATVDFTTNFNGKNDYMYFLTKFEENKDMVIYIDHIEIAAFSQPYESVVAVYPNNGEQTIILKGNRGDKIELPKLTNKNGAEFLGYYADENLESEFAKTVFERNAINVYVKWSVPPISFGDYPYDTSVTGIFGCTFKIKNEEKAGYDDDYALHFRFIGDEPYSYKSDGTVDKYVYQRAKEYTNVAKLTTVSQGKTYLITYYYKQISSSSDVTFSIITANSGNVWAPNSIALYDTTSVKVPAGENGEWQKVSVLFETDLKEDISKNNGLYLRAIVSNASMETKCNVLIDRIVIDEVIDDVVIFNGNDEGVATQYVIGKAGQTLEIPTITNGKKEFLGWFTNKECTVLFESTTIPAGITTVYAKWGAAPMAFDNYLFDTSNTGIFGCTFKIKKDKNIGFDDDYVLQFDFEGDKPYSYNADGSVNYYIYQRATQRTNVAKIGTAKSNTLYKLTFNYKQVGSNCDISIFPATGHSSNIWGNGYVEYTSSATTVTAGENESWKNATVYFKTDVLEGNTNGLYFKVNVLKATMETNCNVYIDDVFVEEITDPYVFFELQNGENAVFVSGKAGGNIVTPQVPVSFGKAFKGWFTDKECTIPFDETVFADNTAITVYAGYTNSSVVNYNFENYTIPYKNEVGNLNLRQDSQIVKTDKAYSGNTVIEYDRTREFNTAYSYHAVAYGDEIFNISKDEIYVISVKYNIVKKISANLIISVSTGNYQNFWSNIVDADAAIIPATAQNNVWKTANFVFDGKQVTAENCSSLFVNVKGGDGGVVWIDDVTVNIVPKGQTAVVIDNDGSKDIPTVLMGKKGASFANKLPKSPKMENKFFKGYFVLGTDNSYSKLEVENMTFGDKPYTIYARFVNLKVSQGFEEEYVEIAQGFDVSTIYDFDYEIYDSYAEGNSKDNVTEGKYSLHRKGNSLYLENSILFTNSNPIVESERYRISFDIKVGKHLHTEGAVKIVSCKNPYYAWDTMGDYYAVAPIADIADGNWHRVSYVFNSVEAFLSIQTPGYVELFIDNVTVELITDDTPVSTPFTYTDYVQRRLDENGKEITKSIAGLDISTIIATSAEEVSPYFVYGLIGSGAVVVIIIGVVVILLIKKFKKKKNNA